MHVASLVLIISELYSFYTGAKKNGYFLIYVLVHCVISSHWFKW